MTSWYIKWIYKSSKFFNIYINYLITRIYMMYYRQTHGFVYSRGYTSACTHPKSIDAFTSSIAKNLQVHNKVLSCIHTHTKCIWYNNIWWYNSFYVPSGHCNKLVESSFGWFCCCRPYKNREEREKVSWLINNYWFWKK